VLLTRAMLMLHRITDRVSDMRPTLKNVFIRRVKGEPATLQVTDGSLIVRITEGSAPHDEDFPNMGEATDGGARDRMTFTAAVPGDRFAAALKTLPNVKATHEILRFALFPERAAADGNAAIATTDLDTRTVIRAKLETPPPVLGTIDGYIAKTDGVKGTDFHIDATLLEEVIAIARAHAGKKKGELLPIALHVPAKTDAKLAGTATPLKITTPGSDGFFALIAGLKL